MNKTHLDNIKIITFLRKVEVFQYLDEKDLNNIVDALSIKTYKKNETVYVTEDFCENTTIIYSGLVKLLRETLDGKEAVIGILKSKNFFGEEFIFKDSNLFSYSVSAIEETVLIKIPNVILNEIFKKNNFLLTELLKYQIFSSETKNKEIELSKTQTAAQRICCFILRSFALSKNTSKNIQLPYDKNLIALQLGITPETFSRTLKKLEPEVKITIKGNEIIIPFDKPAALLQDS